MVFFKIKTFLRGAAIATTPPPPPPKKKAMPPQIYIRYWPLQTHNDICG